MQTRTELPLLASSPHEGGANLRPCLITGEDLQELGRGEGGPSWSLPVSPYLLLQGAGSNFNTFLSTYR